MPLRCCFGNTRGYRRRPVAAVVIYNDDAKEARIVLPHEGLSACRDIFGFIARWDHSNHARPGRRLWRPYASIAYTSKPKSPPPGYQIKPDQNAENCQRFVHEKMASGCIRPLLLTSEIPGWFDQFWPLTNPRF